MKLLVIGILLLIYAMFLTPCYFEPSDIVVSTAYIAGASAIGIPTWIIILWIASGYIALVIAIALGVHFAIRVKHPVVMGIVIAIFALIIGYYLIVVNNIISF